MEGSASWYCRVLFTSNSTAPIANEVRLDIDNELVRQDVCMFLNTELESFDVPNDTKSVIRDAFSEKALLYTGLGLFVLKQDSDVMAISQLLDGMTPSLYQLYDRVLEKCSTGPFVPSEYRRSILSLSLYPVRRFRRPELLAALEVVFGPEAKITTW